jgi:hypothetical protein
MGTASKVLSACVRVVELGCACIITGVLGKFFHRISQGGGIKEPILTYALSMAVISILFSIFLLPPVKYSFYCFPLDFALFICWIVCFALLEDLSGTKTCQSLWYSDYWSYYWGRVWTTTNGVVVASDFGCSQWRVVLAFSFIISMSWLLNAFLSLYVCIEYYHLGKRIVSIANKLRFWKKQKRDEEENVPDPREERKKEETVQEA